MKKEETDEHLDAFTKLEDWLNTARIRIPIAVTVEWQPKNRESKFANRAGLNLISENFLGAISIVGTGYAGQTAYGHIDYDCINKNTEKGDCAYAQIDNDQQLVRKLDEFLDNFIERSKS